MGCDQWRRMDLVGATQGSHVSHGGDGTKREISGAGATTLRYEEGAAADIRRRALKSDAEIGPQMRPAPVGLGLGLGLALTLRHCRDDARVATSPVHSAQTRSLCRKTTPTIVDRSLLDSTCPSYTRGTPSGAGLR